FQSLPQHTFQIGSNNTSSCTSNVIKNSANQKQFQLEILHHVLAGQHIICMDSLVCLESRHLTKGLSTLRTLIRLFPSMDPLVFLENRHVSKVLSTLRTLIRLFPSMDSLVCLEMTYLAKGISAMRTLVRLFRGVCGPMDGEI